MKQMAQTIAGNLRLTEQLTNLLEVEN